MAEAQCARCGGSGEIRIGGYTNWHYITCNHCDGEGVTEIFDSPDGVVRDTSYSPTPQRHISKY